MIPPFCRRHFQKYFLDWKCTNDAEDSNEICSNEPINNITALALIMAWRRSGDRPSSEPMMVSLLTRISVTRTLWVNGIYGIKHWLQNLIIMVIYSIELTQLKRKGDTRWYIYNGNYRTTVRNLDAPPKNKQSCCRWYETSLCSFHASDLSEIRFYQVVLLNAKMA